MGDSCITVHLQRDLGCLQRHRLETATIHPPAFHPNGTLFMICNHMSITSASSWDEEWQPERGLGKSGGDRQRHWEDPTLWFDRRGNFHILYHVYCLLPYTDDKE